MCFQVWLSSWNICCWFPYDSHKNFLLFGSLWCDPLTLILETGFEMVAAFETFPFEGAKTKRLGFYLADFLGCPISCLFLYTREVLVPRESQNLVFSLWHSLYRWAINLHLYFHFIFCTEFCSVTEVSYALNLF